ncbi:MAG TPA: M23 family metallopeptidase [Gaiellales bacterium]|nr:M23 family metallopeptidase [Gaiellales bacterium]
MTRIIALTILCTASLAAGVVVASPSLASAFRSHPPRVHHPRWLWQYSVSGPASGSTNPEAETYPSTTRTAKHRRATPQAPYSTPAPTTTPTATGDPAPGAPTTTAPPTTTKKPAGPRRPPELPRFTLRSVDTRCFTAPSAPGGWPFAPTTAVHPIRGSFDEPRSPVHIGVDVEAPRDQAPVYAMQSGTVRHVTRDHFDVHAAHGRAGTYLQYWHVNLAAGIRAGTVVRRRQKLGTVKAGMKHVHISEFVPGCGLVDPARPNGLLADPYNTEWPSIGSLSAVAAGSRAFVPLSLSQAPADLTDPSHPVDLDALSGTVDLRASVTDMPKVRMRHDPQMPLAPAAIRAYLTPAANTRRHLTMRLVFDGSKLLPNGAGLWRYWAFGTYRLNGCYFTSDGSCGMQMVWHVGGPHGFDTRSVPNGSYRYCVEALTIAGVDARRCTPVTIKN